MTNVSDLPRISAIVGYSHHDKSLHIRWGKLPIARDQFVEFLNDSLKAMGFQEPHLVYFGRDRRGRTDWEDMRIPETEFTIHDVDMRTAAEGLKKFLESSSVQLKYKMKFYVTITVLP